MILPGFGNPKVSVPEASPPPPERTDPAVVEAKNRLRQSELRRRGRAATMLTTRDEQLSPAPVKRPQASATLG